MGERIEPSDGRRWWSRTRWTEFVAPPIRDRRAARRVRAAALPVLSSILIHRVRPRSRKCRETAQTPSQQLSKKYCARRLTRRADIHRKLIDLRTQPSQTTLGAIQMPAMGQRGQMALAYGPCTHPWLCGGRDLRKVLSFWEVEEVCMLSSTSSPPLCAHPAKNTARPESMRNTILSRFCIFITALCAFVAVL